MAISADGRYVAFNTGATNMDSNHVGGGVFVRDMTSGSLTRIDARGDSASFSADDQKLAVTDVTGTSPDFVNTLELYDMTTKSRAPVDPRFVRSGSGTLDASGDRVLFGGTASAPIGGVTTGLFIHDFTTGVTTPVSGIPSGVSIEGVSSDLDQGAVPVRARPLRP